MMEEEAPLLKLVLIGDSHAGKTFLLKQFSSGGLTGALGDDVPPTPGVEFQTCRVMLAHPSTGAAVKVKLNIWDTSGHSRYASIVNPYLAHVHGAMCVYDVTNPASLRHAISWFRRLRHASPRAYCALVGTKRDLRVAAIASVSAAEGAAAAHKLRMDYHEVAAGAAEDVTRLFMLVAQACLHAAEGAAAPPAPATAAASATPDAPLLLRQPLTAPRCFACCAIS